MFWLNFLSISENSMDAQKVATDYHIQDSARSLSATPLNAHHQSRMDARCNPPSVTEHDEFLDFLHVHKRTEKSAASDHDTISWQNLEMQLMHATLLDKELSELCFQRAMKKQTHLCSLRYERKSVGSWSSLAFLLLGIVPASLFVFALACTIYSIKIVYPQ